MGAYATDFLEKNWPSKYGGRGGGSYSGGRRKIANNKGGFIWDNAKRSGVSFRTYGEFADNFKASIPVLRNHFCTYYSSWDLEIKDTSRFFQWKHDFDSLLAINAVPQLNTIRFPNDHTEGMKVGRPTPFAHVADNDLAVGMFMEYLSHSSIWDRSVVFILEDDAQNGPDHVDAHRSTAYVAGPMIKRKFTDHTPYTTSGLLRTIELILHMPPMTQYDAGAEPLWRCFTAQHDRTPFKCLPSNVDLDKINVTVNGLSRKSDSFDFSEEDNIPDGEFTEVIWKGVKGINSEVPAPVRGAFLKVDKKKGDD
jgi:hypothetical protein